MRVIRRFTPSAKGRTGAKTYLKMKSPIGYIANRTFYTQKTLFQLIWTILFPLTPSTTRNLSSA